MAKKKKKGSNTPKTNEKESSDSTTFSNLNTVDLLTVHLSKSSSGSSKRSGKTPRVVISESDAAKLDILQEEDAIVLASGADDHSMISGAAICKVELSTSALTTPSRSGGKRLTLRPGNIQITPPSVVDCLLGHECIPTNVGTPILIQTPSTPSTTQASFSFKSGGGGDQLYSTPTSPSPAKSTPSKQPSNPFWIVPLESNLGSRISKLVCTEASKLHIKLLDHNNDYRGSEQVLKRLVLAHFKGQYLSPLQKVTISFRGKPLELETEAIDGDKPVDILQSTFADLNIDDASSDHIEEEVSILRSLASRRIQLFKVTYDTEVALISESSTSESMIEKKPEQAHVLGLSSVMDRVRSLLLTPLTRPELFSKGSMKKPKGVLLHGPSGVGKSSLAKQIASEMEPMCDVQYVNCISLQSQTSIVGEAERSLSKLFRISPNSGKSNKLLIFDDVHLICPKRGGYSPGTDQLASTLLALIDGIGNPVKEDRTASIVILAITTNPSLLDPALRRPGRLDAEVEVPIPDEVSTRAEIIRFHLERMGATIPELSEDEWSALGKLAKGFNGADCMLAVKEALRNAIRRACTIVSTLGETETKDLNSVDLTLEDIQAAIRATKPSAIKSITVEIPKVYWSSIGGMETVKRELREAIEMPLAHAELFEKLNVPPPRGILLFGPPGCSKTLMARALATEGQMNFLAVKGPELLSKWLGESERALASLFRRARMASPSIIFFDEIDAIASKRGSGDSASSGRLLSQLLTELDGITHTAAGSKKQRVVVVGATNRPDLLDNALTRPGRIDRMIYVGVPDSESRARIFQLSLEGRACGDDIDVHHLAKDEVSQGFSGAELVAICRDAALLALEESDDPMAVASPTLEMCHLVKAISSMQRQISPEMLDFYASFRDYSFENGVGGTIC